MSSFSSLRNAYAYFKSIKYIGKKYQCPFCGGNFSTFKPTGLLHPVLSEKKIIGGGFRENAICPRCYSSDRERLVYLYLMNEKNYVFREHVKLLHVAPEKELSRILKKALNIEYLSADLNASDVDVKMDITNIQYSDCTFDIVICNHVLEHIVCDYKAISEIYRTLRRGGFAVLQVPISLESEKTFEDALIIDPIDREKQYGQSDHVRIYGRDYVNKLENIGFDVDVVDYSNMIAIKYPNNYGLIADEKVFVCYKK